MLSIAKHLTKDPSPDLIGIRMTGGVLQRFFMKRIILVTILIASCILAGFLLLFFHGLQRQVLPQPTQRNLSSSPTPTPQPPPVPEAKILQNDYHVFQTFNNCGPAALSMALSYYGVSVSQQELGEMLRPYQIASGDNDDKSVTLEELAAKSKDYGFIPIHRANGNIELVKRFIAADMPVITRTLLKQNEDIGHYRLVKGYDDITSRLLQDDSLQRKNLWYSYEEFLILWEKFNYEYLVLVPKDKKHLRKAILDEDYDPKNAWEKAAITAEKKLAIDPSDIYAHFNLSIAYYHIGDFRNSVIEFEKVEDKLPFRTLWYQIEPVEAYFALKDYDRVFELTEKIFTYDNRAFSELYFMRGQIYLRLENTEAARSEFEKALFYNRNFIQARHTLQAL